MDSESHASYVLSNFILPETLAGANRLQSLDLRMPLLHSVNTVLRLFGNLEHLVCLRTVQVCVSRWSDTNSDQAEWSALEGLVSVLPALAELHVYSGDRMEDWEPYEERLLKVWMPVLAGRDVLRVHGWPPDN
jgi:hypothetical protein